MQVVDVIIQALIGPGRLHADGTEEPLDVAAVDHQGLVAVLRAASAPASLAELDGEEDAIATFRAARANFGESPHSNDLPLRRRSAASRSRLAIACSGSAVVLLATGIGYAASEGRLLTPLQSYAHQLLVWCLVNDLTRM
jgi:hypothetical protein